MFVTKILGIKLIYITVHDIIWFCSEHRLEAGRKCPVSYMK